MYENIHGLSCIENHVLAILRLRGEPIEYAFNDCAIPLSELYARLVTDGVKQEYFNAVPRVQDVLKEMGVLSLELNTEEAQGKVKQTIRGCKENEYVLMLTDPEYAYSAMHIRGFRNDHYAWVRKDGKEYVVNNDIPENEYRLDSKMLTRFYGGKFFKMKVLKPIDDQVISRLWDNRNYTPRESGPAASLMEDFERTADMAGRLRDMAGVCKIMRYRMAEYYGHYADTGFIREAMPEYERIHSTLEYYRLKPKTAYEKIDALMAELFEMDNRIMAALIEKR